MLMKNAKIENSNWDIFGDFQTQWSGDNDSSNHHLDLSKEWETRDYHGKNWMFDPNALGA